MLNAKICRVCIDIFKLSSYIYIYIVKSEKATDWVNLLGHRGFGCGVSKAMDKQSSQGIFQKKNPLFLKQSTSKFNSGSSFLLSDVCP